MPKWINALEALPPPERAVAVLVTDSNFPLTGHIMDDGRWHVPNYAYYHGRHPVVHFWCDCIPQLMAEAREAEWTGTGWVALQRQGVWPGKLVRGSSFEWWTDAIPSPARYRHEDSFQGHL